MAAQIIHLQQLHAFGQKRKIFLDLCRVGYIVNDADAELCTGDHTFDLAGIGHRVGTGNCVLGLDLGHTHIGKLFCIGQKGIRKLQAGTTHRFRGTEQTQNALVVLVESRHVLNILTGAAGQQGAQLAFQAAAGYDGITGIGVTHHRAVHSTNGRKGRGTADVHTGAHFQIAPDQNFSIHMITPPCRRSSGGKRPALPCSVQSGSGPHGRWKCP